MNRYLETFFRRWLFILMPLVVLGAVEAYQLRHTSHLFAASTNVYVTTSPLSQDPSSFNYTTPAQLEAGNLMQWLQSPQFCLSVAKGSPLYSRVLQYSPNPLAQASADLSKNVVAIPKGTNLLSIGYTSPNPGLAMEVLNSVLTLAAAGTQRLQVAQNSQLRTTYQYQLSVAQAAERQSTSQLTDYMQQHSVNASNLNDQLVADPTLSGLYQQNKNDHAQVVSLQSKIQNLLLKNSLPSGLANQTNYVMVDPPSWSTQSNRKSQLMTLGIVMAIALLLAGGILVVLTATDRTLRHPAEVLTLLELPVVGIVPYSGRIAPSAKQSRRAADWEAPTDEMKGIHAS